MKSLVVVCLALFSVTASAADMFARNKELGRGVNLGNALEAPNEGEWGMKIEDEFFPLIKQAGFKHVRLPVKWTAHAAKESPFTVDAAFFARVDHLHGGDPVGIAQKQKADQRPPGARLRQPGLQRGAKQQVARVHHQHGGGDGPKRGLTALHHADRGKLGRTGKDCGTIGHGHARAHARLCRDDAEGKAIDQNRQRHGQTHAEAAPESGQTKGRAGGHGQRAALRISSR